MRGGRTYLEQLGDQAMERLEIDHEHHNTIQLPCCGTMVEIVDFTKDNYITCPNTQCMKHHIVLGGGLNPQIRSEVDDEPKHLIY